MAASNRFIFVKGCLLAFMLLIYEGALAANSVEGDCKLQTEKKKVDLEVKGHKTEFHSVDPLPVGECVGDCSKCTAQTTKKWEKFTIGPWQQGKEVYTIEYEHITGCACS